MGELIVDQVLSQLPVSRQTAIQPSRTAALPLRFDQFDRAELESELGNRFEVVPWRSAYLVATYGIHAEALLKEASPELRRPIGTSRYTLAEIPWSFTKECPASLCDLLERRLRMVIFAVGQGLPELTEIAQLAAEAAGWDEERMCAEAGAYAAAVRRRYQIVATGMERSAA